MRHPEDLRESGPPVWRLSLPLVLLLLATPALAHAAGLEETLKARWRGAFVVVRVPVASDCDGYYNDYACVCRSASSLCFSVIVTGSGLS